MNTKKIKVMAVGMFLIGITFTKLAFADEPHVRIRPIHSAYENYLLYPRIGGSYVVTTSDELELGPQNEVARVDLYVPGFPTAADYIETIPVQGGYPAFECT